MQHKAIEVIRHSLNAANAALDMLGNDIHELTEAANTVVEVMTAPVAPVVVEGPTKISLLLEELHHPRFKLRTLDELADKLGLYADEIIDMLRENNIPFVTKVRRADSADLIGLSSRN